MAGKWQFSKWEVAQQWELTKPHHQSPPPGGRETGWWEMSPHNVTLNPTATIPTSRAQLYEQPPSGPHLVQNSDCLYATYERYAVFSSMAMPVLLPVIFPQGQGWVGLTNKTAPKWATGTLTGSHLPSS